MNTAEREMFETKLKALRNISSANAVYVGTPAETDRPVIDRSYDYALTVVFDDIEGHDVYQKDPLHKDFLENCSKFFDKVLIYDAD
jgi:hypothetical protein